MEDAVVLTTIAVITVHIPVKIVAGHLTGAIDAITLSVRVRGAGRATVTATVRRSVAHTRVAASVESKIAIEVAFTLGGAMRGAVGGNGAVGAGLAAAIRRVVGETAIALTMISIVADEIAGSTVTCRDGMCGRKARVAAHATVVDTVIGNTTIDAGMIADRAFPSAVGVVNTSGIPIVRRAGAGVAIRAATVDGAVGHTNTAFRVVAGIATEPASRPVAGRLPVCGVEAGSAIRAAVIGTVVGNTLSRAVVVAGCAIESAGAIFTAGDGVGGAFRGGSAIEAGISTAIGTVVGRTAVSDLVVSGRALEITYAVDTQCVAVFRRGALDAPGAAIQEIVVGGANSPAEVEAVVAEKHTLSVHTGDLTKVRLLTAIDTSVAAATGLGIRTTGRSNLVVAGVARPLTNTAHTLGRCVDGSALLAVQAGITTAFRNRIRGTTATLVMVARIAVKPACEAITGGGAIFGVGTRSAAISARIRAFVR